MVLSGPKVYGLQFMLSYFLMGQIDMHTIVRQITCIIGMKGIEKDARLILAGKICECSDFGF